MSKLLNVFRDLFSRDGRQMRKLQRHLASAKKRMPELIVAAHAHSSIHRAEVLASDKCGCFYCGHTFPPGEIVEWIDGEQTALCPKCEIDSVIGSAAGFPLTKEFLDQMHEHWF